MDNISNSLISTGLNSAGLGLIAEPISGFFDSLFGESEKHKRNKKNKKYFNEKLYPKYFQKYNKDFLSLPDSVRFAIYDDFNSKNFPNKTLQILDNYFNAIPSQTNIISNFVSDKFDEKETEGKSLIPNIDFSFNVNNIVLIIGLLTLTFFISKK